MLFPTDVIFSWNVMPHSLRPLIPTSFTEIDKISLFQTQDLKVPLLPATFVPPFTVAHREVSRIPNPSNYRVPNQLSSSAKRLMLEQPAFSPGNLFPIILFGTLPPHLEYPGAAPLV
jgi:hypothetical protein